MLPAVNSSILSNVAPSRGEDAPRLAYLDATRAFALLLGVVFHASLSFVPVFMGWAVQDVSTSAWVTVFTTVSHAFRMEVFFWIAGFLGCTALRRRGAAAFVRTRVLRIVVPFVVGWFILRPLLVSGWILGAASLRGEADVWAGLRGGFESLSSLPAGIFTGTHLWFLYYLALITGLTLVARACSRATGAWHAVLVGRADAWIARSAGSPVLPLVLAVPTTIALGFMSRWGVDTPDRSMVPHLPVLGVYGGFYLLGWMMGRQPKRVAEFSRLSWPRWLQAGCGIGGILLLGAVERDPGHPHYLAARVVYAVSYAVTMAALAILTLGVFRTWCPRPHRWVRYAADSSYWLYMIHLPIVVWLQVAVAELPFPWSLKLAFVVATTLVVGWLSYGLFVRSTWVGACLQGRRQGRGTRVEAQAK